MPKKRLVKIEKPKTEKDIWQGLVKAFAVDQAVVDQAVRDLFDTQPALALRLQIQLCEVAKSAAIPEREVVDLPPLVVSIRNAIERNKVKTIG